MGLKANGIANGFSGRVFGVAKGAFAPGMFSLFANAAMFGQITSVPQGMNGRRALLMSFKVGGNISAKFQPEASFDAAPWSTGNMSAHADGEFGMIAGANIGFNGYASFYGEFDVVAAISGLGSMAASMDILVRPSANDIAQEVWNSRKESFQSPGTQGKSLSDTEAAAKLAAALSA